MDTRSDAALNEVASETPFSLRTSLVIAISVLSVFLSAFLLFALEPMITRMHLTRYGGSAAVWNTALVFFQAVLLIGYLYAERFHRHRFLHAVVLALPLFFLPPALRIATSDSTAPVEAILLSLAASIGVPFFVLASNTTLVQVWYARSTASRNPCWLYAASNAGAVLALLLYPFVIEPALGIRAQADWWRDGYLAFLTISIALLVLTRRPKIGIFGHQPNTEIVGHKATTKFRASWIVRSAIASSLLMSVTTALTTALGSTPLLWTIPLFLYLATFIIAFGNMSPRRRVIECGCILGIAISMGAIFYWMPLYVVIPGYLLALFAGALLCHRDLFEQRPATSGLPSFYLAIALGGFLGGAFNALLAPLVFDRLSEFPITLAAVAIVIDADRPWRENFSRERLRNAGVVLPPLTMLLMLVIAIVASRSTAPFAIALHASILLGILMFGVLLGRHRGQFTAAALIVTLFLLTEQSWNATTIREERSFFGVSSVEKEKNFRVYRHSGVVHGSEMEPVGRGIATGYYHPATPVARVLARADPGAHIADIGLGVAAIAVYTKPGQRLDFFEIDPVVERIARHDFSFLSHARGEVRIVTGDGRMLLAQQPDRSYDIVFVDAFSGGSVPLHLITAEAIELYSRKSKADGIVMLHVTSRAVAFDRVLRGWSQATGVPVLFQAFRPTPRQAREGAMASDVVAISLSAATRAALMRDGWRPLSMRGRSAFWTDDRASAVEVLNWR